MDLGVDLVHDVPCSITIPLGITLGQQARTMHPFTGIEITEKGVGLMLEYVLKMREIIGWDIPLSADHFGHIGVNSCIRLGKALEKANLAWLEDMVPWQHPELLKQITDAVDIPTLTGEDIYLKEDFQKLCKDHVVDLIHPDLATSGGILETKRSEERRVGKECRSRWSREK